MTRTLCPAIPFNFTLTCRVRADPRGLELSPTRLSPLQKLFTSPRDPLYSQPALNSGVPIPPLLRFHNLLEQLTKLRKALYLHLLAYRKGYNSRTTEGKRCLRQDMGERTGVSMPSLGVSPFRHSSNLEALHYLGIFMEVLVNRLGGLNHWSVVT